MSPFGRGAEFRLWHQADYKETVVDLLARVVTVSLETVATTGAMAGLPVTARDQRA